MAILVLRNITRGEEERNKGKKMNSMSNQIIKMRLIFFYNKFLSHSFFFIPLLSHHFFSINL